MIDQGFEFVLDRKQERGGQGIIVLKTKEILFFCNVMFQNTVTLGNNDKLSYLSSS